MYKSLNVNTNAKYDNKIFKAAINLKSLTNSVTCQQFGDFILYDTPGFNDPNISDNLLWNKTTS